MSERQDGHYPVKWWAYDAGETIPSAKWTVCEWDSANKEWAHHRGEPAEIGPRIPMPGDPPAPQAAVDLEALKALCAAATPGPWERGEEYDHESRDVVPDKALHGPNYLQESFGSYQEVSDTVCVFGFSAHRRHEANLAFVKASRTAMPALIHELESLHDQLARAYRERDATVSDMSRELESLRARVALLESK